MTGITSYNKNPFSIVGIHEMCSWRSIMELRQLRYFVTVVESGSFTAAAGVLHMTQPPLSLAVGQLERELGVELLIRSARGVRVTSAGSNVLEFAQRILGDVEEMSDSVARHAAGTRGRVTLAAVPSLMWSRVPAFARELEEQFPEIDLRLTDPEPLAALDMILHRTVDIALVISADNRRLAENQPGQLEVVPCGDFPLVAVFPTSDSGLPDPVALNEMSGRTLFMPRRAFAVPSLSEIVEDVMSARAVVPAGRRAVDSIPSAIPLIAAGLGAAVLPDLGENVFGARGLTVRAIDPPLPALQIAAIWRRDLVPSPAVARVQSLLRDGGLGQ
ncbi:LysR family transcriptional regulator [Microbacterium sp. A8/3-1]|uniref:LysR family transcriptional regulator n=1 Tax=Microbacterium sp. A8/3-1 TaxID=3160749 RepID=A0AAU7VVZ9_9MICO